MPSGTVAVCTRRNRRKVGSDVKAMEKLSKNAEFSDDPSAPLKVKAWTDKKVYKTGDKIKIYVKATSRSMPGCCTRMQAV